MSIGKHDLKVTMLTLGTTRGNPIDLRVAGREPMTALSR